MSEQGKDKFWQTAGVIILGLIALSLVYNQLFAANGTMVMNGYGMGYRMGYNNMGYNMGNYNGSGLLGGTLVLAIQLFKFLLVVGIILGTYCAIKRYVFDNQTCSLNLFGQDEKTTYACPNCQTKLDAEFKFCPSCKTALKKKCSCGADLQLGWKWCPNCGNDNQ